MGRVRACLSASYTLAFALQLKKIHGKTLVRVGKTSVRVGRNLSQSREKPQSR